MAQRSILIKIAIRHRDRLSVARSTRQVKGAAAAARPRSRSLREFWRQCLYLKPRRRPRRFSSATSHMQNANDEPKKNEGEKPPPEFVINEKAAKHVAAYRRLETDAKRWVCAAQRHGWAAGFELAPACHQRIAATIRKRGWAPRNQESVCSPVRRHAAHRAP